MRGMDIMQDIVYVCDFELKYIPEQCGYKMDTTKKNTKSFLDSGFGVGLFM